MTSVQIPALLSKFDVPKDEQLKKFPKLFDNEWVWKKYCDALDEPEESPQQIRIRSLSYRAGRRAIVSYVAEWESEDWIIEDIFSIETRQDGTEEFYHFPDDPRLPGLSKAASALEAHRLVNKYVASTRKVKVNVKRYRPGGHAVLQHKLGHNKATSADLYVRVMRPNLISSFMKTVEIAAQSGFIIPRIAGCWAEGGVVWLNRIPGKTVRNLINSGRAPDPNSILDALSKLWATPIPSECEPRDLNHIFQSNISLFQRIMKDEPSRQILNKVTSLLEPFVEKWRPTALAHNDFYDDQMLVTPSGQLALVDFEEIGPGDPMLDVGTLLAHLRWKSTFGIVSEENESYRRTVRSDAIKKFDWDEHELAMREGFEFFSICNNPARYQWDDWQNDTKIGLETVLDILAGVP